MRHVRFAALLLALAAAVPLIAVEPEPPAADGTAKAQQQIATFRVPAGLKVDLWAAEPMLASPVAISLDEKNRVYVAEEYRLGRGVAENRNNPAFAFSFFLDDDLQVKTLDDRLAMFKKWEGRLGGPGWYTKYGDQVRLLQDTKGTGKADKSTVFAGGFNGPLDGLAAGVLAKDGDVYFTCIPHLWKLKDTNGDGVADVREKVLSGFGVNVAFFGHDLHGLTVGPDGKLYFSIGDRGFHVTSKEGATFSGPRTGAVFRCDPDGSNFEVVHRGLRNPQELAFDQYGNLFADDNNCDKGDHARLVYVVEDGDSGWNMAYQTINSPYTSGPWFAERLWHLPHAGQPAYIVPPVGKIGTGPGGFLFTSGTSLPDRYRNSFIMCNYTGTGGLEAFKVKPKGAGFEIDDYHDFLKPIRATDAEFGYDGKLYVSDFVNLDWSGKSAGGRIYTVSDSEKLKDPVVQETKRLFAEGFKQRGTKELVKLLAHPDQRVRLRAQFALAADGSKAVIDTLTGVIQWEEQQLARLHALWALGQIARTDRSAMAGVIPMTGDADPEFLAQMAKVLGDTRETGGLSRLLPLLDYPSPRVRFFVAQALGKMRHKPAVPELFKVLAENKDEDPHLRHACVVALARIGDADAVAARATDPNPSVRLAVVLVQRKLGDRRVTALLDDADPLVRTEAARAVHDVLPDDVLPALAAQLPKLTASAPVPDGDALARRAISAAYRVGGPENAKAVLAAVTSSSLSAAVRQEAVAALREWADPPPRDRVTGFWRPLPKRDPAVVRQVVEAGLTDLLSKTTGKVQTDAVGLILKVGAKADEGTFAGWATDPAVSPNTRVAALRFLAERKSPQAPTVLTAALKDASPLVRSEARELVAKADPTRGLPLLAGVLDDAAATVGERQRALATTAAVKTAEAGKLLDAWAERLAAGKVPAELELDVTDALKAAPSPARDKLRGQYDRSQPTDPIGRFRSSLTGGDADAGREVFFNHSAAQCVRCHLVNGTGGTAGPDLSKLAARQPEKLREYVLESMVNPSAKLAPGFGSVTLNLLDGRVVAGVLMADEKEKVTVKLPDGKLVTVAPDDIETRSAPLSPMPAIDRSLTPREVRDVIEFLASLK